MKILMTILTTLTLLGTIAMSYALFTMDTTDASKINEKITELKENLPEGLAETTFEEFAADTLKEAGVPPISKFTTGRILALLVGLLALVTLIGFFMNLPQLPMIIGGLAVMAIVCWLMHPAYDKGMLGSASNDQVAMVLAGFAVVSAIVSFIGHRIKNKVAA